MVHVDLVLDPPRGVAPVFLGMTLDDAVSALSAFGDPEVVRRSSSSLVAVTCDKIEIQALCEENENDVSAIELWWPGEGKTTTTRVLLEGQDVFATPAKDILRHAEERGWRVDESEAERPVIPGVSLGFTRETSQEVPRDDNGLPLHFTSVLVGDEHYYDYRYPDGF
ncbi:hypothetical protein [Streptomyces sp. F63]|uniref:hypothetical protein n=1 Tax=Streptomyces sp. F63 TaxID=2824887 RepID=UPI0027DB2035|nr:hypothetical protein [Streptomyces sp. F63]